MHQFFNDMTQPHLPTFSIHIIFIDVQFSTCYIFFLNNVEIRYTTCVDTPNYSI